MGDEIDKSLANVNAVARAESFMEFDKAAQCSVDDRLVRPSNRQGFTNVVIVMANFYGSSAARKKWVCFQKPGAIKPQIMPEAVNPARAANKQFLLAPPSRSRPRMRPRCARL